MAYEANVEAYMDRFDHDVEIGLCYDAMKQSMMCESLGLIQTGSS